MEITETMKKYTAPVIELIELDNEISLAMESNANPEGDPSGPLWGKNQDNHPDPFKNLG